MAHASSEAANDIKGKEEMPLLVLSPLLQVQHSLLVFELLQVELQVQLMIHMVITQVTSWEN